MCLALSVHSTKALGALKMTLNADTIRRSDVPPCLEFRSSGRNSVSFLYLTVTHEESYIYRRIISQLALSKPVKNTTPPGGGKGLGDVLRSGIRTESNAKSQQGST